MYIILLVSVLVISSGSLAQFVITAHDPVIEESNNVTARGLFGFDIENFLKQYGYPFENHVVTTEDGYVLGIHRIPYGRNSSSSTFKDATKPTVLIMHGLSSSSADFVILGPERSLPMLLADQGYDVWLGNNRGNTWSRKHTTLDPDKNKTFWDFSFHELGIYDTSAIIDYVVNATGNEKINYIGHSQGCTQFFALMSDRPAYNDKIKLMMGMGPAVYSQNMSNPLVQLVKDHYTLVELVGDYLNLTEILKHSFVLETALKLICKDESQYQEVCVLGLFLFYGFDAPQFNRSILTTMLDAWPAGLALKQFKHYLQIVKSGHFRQFDYGILNNFEIYNKSAPPDYNLALVTAPVVLYYSKNDWLVATTNVDQLADELPNVVEKHLIEYDYFNHIDYLLATDVVSLLYFDLINKLNEANGFDPITSSSAATGGPTKPTEPNGSGATTSATEPGSDLDPTTPGSAFSLTSSVHVTCLYIFLLMFLI